MTHYPGQTDFDEFADYLLEPHTLVEIQNRFGIAQRTVHFRIHKLETFHIHVDKIVSENKNVPYKFKIRDL